MTDTVDPPAATARLFKIPTFTPTQSEIWVDMVQDAFTIHGITDEKRKMLEIRMALTQELRALTAHITAEGVPDAYIKLVTYLKKYGARTEVEKMRAMVSKRPIGDRTPVAHLQALRVEFGGTPQTEPILLRIFEDSLSPSIASLLAAERISDIDAYAERAAELYILYQPARDEVGVNTLLAPPVAAPVSSDPAILAALQAMNVKMDSLSERINKI